MFKFNPDLPQVELVQVYITAGPFFAFLLLPSLFVCAFFVSLPMMDLTSPLSPPITPGARTVPRKASAKNLNSALSPQGARPKARPRPERPKTIHESPSSKKTKGSPGRGLTVLIQDGMSLPQSIQSAPVKTLRPLPSVPVPPLPTASAVTFSTPSTSLATSSSSAGVADQQTPRRALRPLPCPPPALNLPPVTPPRYTNSPSPPSTERPRAPAVKPLPIPVLKVEPLRLSRHAPSQSLPCSGSPLLGSLDTPIPSPRSRTPPPSLPPPVPEKPTRFTFTHARDCSRDEVLSDLLEPIKVPALSPEAPTTQRIILSQYQALDDSDQVSEDEDEDVFGDMVTYSRGKEDEGADYSWILSNRILYRQMSPSAEDSSKWVREKKGRRITEQDYENILNALRSL
ncbi:unnamed protein product [Cyclocybe aegerita]|uniref:Uncharacterized protein n=1 Tax=Cyclocybe aegerita TaxID=1973307 RepID=A0A8S0WSK3_CYCAE|nr:unnamed protein product [Cyclocybe aegerita]